VPSICDESTASLRTYIEKKSCRGSKDGSSIEPAGRTLRGAEATEKGQEVDVRARRQGRGNEGAHDFAADSRFHVSTEPRAMGRRASHSRIQVPVATPRQRRLDDLGQVRAPRQWSLRNHAD
jgi:hypothetical protein